MAGEKTLKLKASFDVSEVTSKANQAVADINRVQAAAQATNTGAGLAVSPTGFGLSGPAGAFPRAIDSAVGADRIRLTRSVAVETQRLADISIRGRIALQSLFAATGIGSYLQVLRTVVSLVRSLSVVGVGGGGALAGGLAGAGAIAYAANQAYRTNQLNKATGLGAIADNNKTIGDLKQLLESGNAAGAFRGGDAAELVRRLRELEDANTGAGKKKNTADRNAAAGAVSAGLSPFIRDMQAAAQQSYTTENEAARQQAEVQARIQRAGLDIEIDQLHRRHKAGLVDTQDYNDKLALLLGQQTYAQKTVLDVEEQQLRASLARRGNDVEGSAQDRARLVGITGEKAALDAELRAQQAASAVEDTPRSTRSRQLTLLERLANRGVGGRGDSDLRSLGTRSSGGGGTPQIEMQQLEELRRLNSNFSGLPGGIAEKL